MWVIVHTVSGMALGAALGSSRLNAPWWALVLAALAAHALLDIVPHWDYTRRPRLYLWALGDVGVSALTFVAAWQVFDAPWYVLLGAAVSAAPDLDVLDAVLPIGRHRRLFPSHWKPYPHGRAGPVVGTLVQLVVVTASLALVVWLVP